MQNIQSINTDPVQLEKLAVTRQLAAEIAHEIWNPLAVIKTIMFAMRADVPPEDPRCADFDVVNEEVDRMERSVQRFLDYTWPPDPIFAPVSLGQIVANAMGLLVRRAEGQGVQIEAGVDLDVIILADQRQIEQVFVNLGLNALQAMPEGGKLSIVAKTEQVFVNLALNALPASSGGGRPNVADKDGKTERGGDGLPLNALLASSGGGRPNVADKDGKAAEGGDGEEGPGMGGVEVTDTGGGIPEEVIDRVFEPFVMEKGREMGLGLALVQQIVERHGGQVAAHNRPEGGATFTVTLPLMGAKVSKVLCK